MASQEFQLSDSEMLEAGNVVTLNGNKITLTLKRARNNNPYLLVEKRADEKIHRSCWFLEDWDALTGAMEKVQVDVPNVYVEDDVRPGKTLSIASTPSGGSQWNNLQVGFKAEGKATFSIHFSRDEWLHLCQLEEYITDLINPGQTMKRKRTAEDDDCENLKRKRTSNGGDCEQWPVMSRPGLPYYRWVLKGEPSLIDGKREVTKSRPFLERALCVREAQEARGEGDESQITITEHEYSGYNDCIIMKDVYLWMLLRQVQALHAEAEGTTNEDADDNWAETVQLYAEQACEMIQVDDIVALHAKFVELMGGQITPQLGTIARCLKLYMDDTIEEPLTESKEVQPRVLDIALSLCKKRLSV